MTMIPEWAWKVWAKVVPSYRDGRFDVGPLAITIRTRKQLQLEAWEAMLHGIYIEKDRPGVVAEMVSELHRDQPKATVHRLRAV